MTATRLAERVPPVARWFAVVGIAGSILAASIVDPGDAVAQSGPLGLLAVSTWAHVGGYAALAFAVLWSFEGSVSVENAMIAGGTLGVVVYGALIELLQSTLPYRSCTVADMTANGVGALLGVTTWALLDWIDRH